jgi:uncharacterized SAM-binding protein YcdF (DUF218 family)
MALLLFGLMLGLPLLSLLWIFVAIWLAKRRLRWLAVTSALLAALPWCILLPDYVPLVGGYFQPGQLFRQNMGMYLVINLALLFGAGPMVHFFLASTASEGHTAG